MQNPYQTTDTAASLSRLDRIQEQRSFAQNKKLNEIRRRVEHLTAAGQSMEATISTEPLLADKPDDEGTFKLQDSFLYHDRKPNYKIISNRLRILQKKHKDFPKMRIYVNKNACRYSDTFSPLMNKLRIMPQERARVV